MSQTSEEKSLPATDRKLREGRKKGQVSKSQDFVCGTVILVATIVIAFSGTASLNRVEQLLDLGSRVQGEPFETAWPRLFEAAVETLFATLLPLLAGVVAAVVLANVVAMKGFVISAEPLVPRFEKINPVAGFKRIFSMRSVVEFLKGILKVAALGAAFLVVFRLGLSSLFNAPACGDACLAPSFFGVLGPLVATAVIAFLLVGAIDILLQNWLFKRDMRMTKSEHKREQRDVEGDPHIRQQRRRERKDMQIVASKVGLLHASILVGTADGPAVGVRYKRGETPVPMVVCRASAGQSRAMITEALLKDIPVIGNAALAEALSRGAAAGRPIPERTFPAMAEILVQQGLI